MKLYDIFINILVRTIVFCLSPILMVFIVVIMLLMTVLLVIGTPIILLFIDYESDGKKYLSWKKE